MLLVLAHGLAPRGHAREHRGAARPLPPRPRRRTGRFRSWSTSPSTSASWRSRCRAASILTAAGRPAVWLAGSAGWRPLSAPLPGATVLFLVARSALGEGLTARAGPWLAKLREGFKEDALSYLLFLRLVPAFPFWFVNIAAGHPRRAAQDLRCRHIFWYHSRHFRLRGGGCGPRQRHRGREGRIRAMRGAESGAQACKLSIHASSLVTKELVLALVLLGVVALIPVAVRKWRSTPCSSQMTARSA